MQVIDQMGRSVVIHSPVKRIVSLVPSQTEFLYDLGLTSEVVGITKFCVHPESWWRNKKRVGGTKDPSVEKIRALQPDLIIGNKEENDQKKIEALTELAPVWMSDITTLDEAYDMMERIGQLVDKEFEAKKLCADIQLEFSQLKPIQKNTKALYFIWKNPWMLAGQNTFVSEMLSVCGFENQATEERYPIFDPKKPIACDYIFLSSEPYPFKEKDKLELQDLFPKAKIVLVDGEMFSWYGSRLKLAPSYFQKLLTSIE